MGQAAILCEELFKLGPDTLSGVCWCLHSITTAVVLFANCHQREMEKGWRVFSRLAHSAQEMWRSSPPAAIGWDLQGPQHNGM